MQKNKRYNILNLNDGSLRKIFLEGDFIQTYLESIMDIIRLNQDKQIGILDEILVRKNKNEIKKI